MGLKTKIWAFPAAIAAFALFSSSALAETAPGQSRTPPSAAMTFVSGSYGNGGAADCSRRDTNDRPECMSQADAFSTAGEQAAFLGAYQMHFGPYGKIKNKEDRNKLLRETAKAIEECINGRDCDAEKQGKVLKALVQYNMGQDIKMMMLTNNTNREKMRSIDNSDSAQAEAHKLGRLNQTEIESAVASGKDYSLDQSDPLKPYKTTGEVVALSRGTGSTKDPYFQIDESTVTHKIDDTYLRERQILGDKFLSDYSAFLDDFATTDERHERRFYRYVPSKTDNVIQVYDESRGGVSVNEERFREVRAEQQNRNVREALATYKNNLKPIQGFKGDDGKAHITGEGASPSEIGIGEMADIDLADFPGVNFDDLMENGKISEANRARAIARVVNKTFEKTAKEHEEKNAASSRFPASAEHNPNWIHNITLSPATFDKFLDEIWPNSIARQQIIREIPPERPGEDAPHTRDRFRDVQPTIDRAVR